ncbi:MAG: hypothetical protein KC776_27065 [Myxococcales bacterium]|nr:hypothetical protein [Myxococcales bacterium]MCB9583233.1 hypothetical protein [Polyangiaceae bacterium]
MGSPRFDPSRAVKFDLASGQIDADGSRVVIPADAVMQLWRAAGEDAQRDFGRRIGTEIGRQIAEQLETPAEASIESVLEHLGGHLALLGFGSLSLERWGQALVLVVEGSPLDDALIAAVLEGAIQRGLGRDVHAVPLVPSRFLMTGATGAGRARGWLEEGVRWSEVIARLHERGDA